MPLRRSIFIILFQFLFSYLFAQKQTFIVNLSNTNVNEVIMGNGSVNFRDSRIFLYNIWNNDRSQLITVSILPDITSGVTKWDTLANISHLSKVIDLLKMADDNIQKYLEGHSEFNNLQLKFTGYRPVIIKNNKILTTDDICLVEFYNVPKQAGVINFDRLNYISLYPNKKGISKDSLFNYINETYNRFGFTLDATSKLICEGNSGLPDIGGYTFWVSLPPSIDIGWQYYGTERFIFNPEIGVVAGSYKTYLRGGTGSIVNSKISGFEWDTKMFLPLLINGLRPAIYMKEMRRD